MTITIAHFTTISGHFFANCMFNFHKTEVQTVILVSLMSLNLKWHQRYDIHTLQKKTKNATNESFLQNHTKNKNENICILSHRFWTN